MTFLLFFIPVFVLDVFSKYLVASRLVPGETLYLCRDVFDICYVRNSGAAFGIMSSNTVLITLLTSALLIGLAVYVFVCRKRISDCEKSAAALITAGGLGNLLNRIICGYVIDFFNLYFWPVFNVADIAICVGCGLLLLEVLILEPGRQKNNDG